ncbi:MAG: oxidoreductase FAD/NAD(P)-binding domain protein [Streptosporangiaceae bacterium]|nr:oxidoreductase FAD/NAD(P)-binding domain protein [Streptosporangiaceae bacterium]
MVWEPEHGGPLLLVAGGSGLAPLMEMIRLRAAVGSDAEIRLLVSSRSREDVIYRAELERFAGDGLTVVHTLTVSRPPGWTGYARRVDADMLREIGPARPRSRTPSSAVPRPSSRRWPRPWWLSSGATRACGWAFPGIRTLQISIDAS